MIRKATAADIDAVERIYGEVLLAEEEGKTTVGWIRGIYPTRATAEEAVSRGDLFVFEDDGEVLGAGIINNIQVDVYALAPWEYETEDDKVCVLHTLVISSSAAGAGLGKEFVRFYEEYAAYHGCGELRIDTNARNRIAREFYRKLGYREIATVPTTFNGIPGVDLVLLEKRLFGHKGAIEPEIVPMTTEDEIRGKAYVHYKSWHESYSGTVDADYLKNKFTLEKCEAMARKYPENTLVAKVGGRVVGFASYGKYRDETLTDHGEVFAIYVLEKFQKRKIGYALMTAALGRLREYDKVALWVLKDNAKAIDFYKKCGFRPDGAENVISLGTELTEIRMIFER